MKRTTIHTSAALVLLLCLSACKKDKSNDVKDTPITFTATVLNTATTASAYTRATVDGDWEGVQSVAVMIDGAVKPYRVNPSADNKSATLTSDNPYYWTNRADIRVTAWAPCTEGETAMPAVVVRADQTQRADFVASDFIAAIDQSVSYGSSNLDFTHRTALVHITLTDYTEGLESVRLTSLSTENGNPNEIVPHDKGNYTYSALVAPQTVAAGTEFITCVFDSGRTFAYRMQNAIEWKAGGEYTYTISLIEAMPDYTVSEDGKTYTVYTAEGLLAWNEATQSDLSLNCILARDIDLTGREWTPIGRLSTIQYTGTFDGGGHTITGLTWHRTTETLVGMITKIGPGGVVKDVRLEEVRLTGDICVGAVAGVSYGGSIIGCSSSGKVYGQKEVGGIVGRLDQGTIRGCYSSAEVSGLNYVGGVMGLNGTYVTVTACYHATGNVLGNNDVGGVIGANFGTVTACYWSDTPETGIGNNNGEATEVTDGNWAGAVEQMNTALQCVSAECRYEIGADGLPVLKKKQ